ncbi:MAG TPA: beta-ketoacyl-ACP synthase 3, partial [Polyangiaceae bacterium]
MQVGILGTGMYLPSRIVSNHELSTTLETTNEWIVEKLGIRQRHIAAPEQATSDLAVEAARRALDDANTRASELDLIIVATSTPDMLQPPTAAFVQARLESPGAAAFDVAAVCAGFVYAISVAASMLAFNSRWKRALVIGADTYSRILDWKDRKTCVIFGDGAGAVVLGQVEPGLGIVATTLGSDGTKAALVRYPGGGSRFPASQATITKN